MIWDRPVSEPFFSGREHGHLYGERSTFPKLLLTAASYHDGTREVKLRSRFQREDIHELRLPELEDNKFFYYFEGGSWSDVKHINRRLDQLTPLSRASLLKMLKLF
jgi:hypothetical protein